MAQSPYLDQNAPEILALERQKKLADLLQSRALEQPQGQMVSGRYVAPSIIQQLAPLANAYMGRKAGENYESEAGKLAQKLREQNLTEGKDILSTMMGQEGVAGNLPLGGTNQAIGSLEEPMGDYVAPKAAVAPDKLGALMKALGSQGSIGQSLAPQLMSSLFKEDTPLILPEGATAVNRRGEVIAKGTPKEEKLYSVNNNLVKADGTVVFQGKDKPIPVGNYLLSPEGKIIFKAEKEYAPQASQIIDTPNGQMAYNPNTQKVTPIMVDGQPLPPKLTSEQSKDITSVNQQRATINGAIKDVENHPEAFSFKRGMAQSMPYGETIAGRLETPEQTQTRAYVFNNVSSVIKERAGTAQTAGELQRINSFLPGPNDNSTQIVNKLKGFNKYLDDLEKGTRISPNAPQKPVENDLVAQAKAELERRKGK